MKNARRNSVVLLTASYLSVMAQEESKQETTKMIITNPYEQLPMDYAMPIGKKTRKGGNNRKGHKRKKAKNGRK